MTSPTDLLLARYRAAGDPDAYEEVVQGHVGLVYHCARQIFQRVGGAVELDDLISAGTIGLVQAIEGFDPRRGHALSTYAMPRIRGAILDDLRRQDRVPRSARARAREVTAARAGLEQQLGRSPAAWEVAERLGLDLAEYWQWSDECERASTVDLDAPLPGSPESVPLSELIPDESAEVPGSELTDAETLAELQEALGKLPPRERLVLSLYFSEELSLRQIGEVLKVTESRASQIRTHALRRLRRSLRPRDSCQPSPRRPAREIRRGRRAPGQPGRQEIGAAALR